ncbi:MAG: retropepsin-like domain-containing protein [Treponema sp.]|nr:retropepsin-like domain-containing protein [Treponema sp.]
MANFHHHNIGFQITPTPPKGTQLGLNLSPIPLFQNGFNIPVEISTASAFRKPPINLPLSSIVVMAHFDTGASITSIDINLAKYLKLQSVGQSESYTASGSQIMPNFAVDISFPNTRLSPFFDLRVGSCRLNFDLDKNLENPNVPKNFGLLLGRDIMSRWIVFWDGQTSTVTISD